MTQELTLGSAEYRGLGVPQLQDPIEYSETSTSESPLLPTEAVDSPALTSSSEDNNVPDYLGKPELSRESVPKKAAKKRPELRVVHSVHDRHQLESVFTFDLRPKGTKEVERNFKVDFYLYAPNAVGVNSATFDAVEFFRNWTSYFRVRAPQFHHLRVLPPEELRFESAESYFFGHLCSVERERLGAKVVQDVKLFGNFLYTELKKLQSGLPRKKRKKKNPEKLSRIVGDLLHRVGLIWAFRDGYVRPATDGQLLIDPEVRQAFMLTDEYLSYRLELALLRAREQAKEDRERIDDFLAREVEYRKTKGMLVLQGAEEKPELLEDYTYRLGLLKKYLGESLFLTALSDKKDNLYRNYVAAIGAGLAATVAGLLEHQRVQYLTGNDSGFRLALLIGVAVIAYIFKDRVKDISKDYFNTRLKERLPDERFRLSHESIDKDGTIKESWLGHVSEYFRFLKEAPADVNYLRHLYQENTTDPERRERVLHLARRFEFDLTSKNHRRVFPLLKNIVRLDVSPFLSKLDNPTTPVSYFGAKGKTRTVQAPKVYHLNGIFRYEVNFGTNPQETRVDYERIRLVVDKTGILRLETILPIHHLAYSQVRS